MYSLEKSRLPSICSAIIATAGILSANSYAQQVALLDSGVDPTAGLNVVGGFNYFNNTADTADVSDRAGEGHGTISARAVAEAFSGEIVPFVVTDGQTELTVEDQVRVARDNALSDSLGQNSIRSIGITWGTPGVVGASASLLPNLSNAGKFVAINAGSDSASQPNPLSSSSFNLGGVIIVGATDASGNFFAETNRAGTTANRYVGANGLPTDGGTEGESSWAAARIAGIAGAVFQQNPNLTAEEVADVILQSAEDRGDVGTDTEFGRGVILSADQVLNNVIGPVVVPVEPTPPPSSGGGGGGGGGAALLIGGALAGALLLTRKSKTKLEKTLVLDSYGRAFEVDLSPHIAVNDEALRLSDFFHSLQQTRAGDYVYLPRLNTEVALAATTNRDHRFDMIEYFSMPDDRVINDQLADVSVALRSQLRDDLVFNSGYRVNAAQSFGASHGLEAHTRFGTSSFISGQSFGSVLSGFSQQANIASLAYLPGKSGNTSLQLGLVSNDQQQRFQQDSFSTIVQGGYQFTDNAGLRLQFGQLEEQGSLLGGASGGVFGVDSSTTYALNISGRLKATDTFSVVANYGVGKTNVEAADDSLLSGFSGLRSDWYSLGLIGNDVFRTQDQLGLAFAQPLKVRAGFLSYALPTTRSADGNILFNRERVNLADTGATERSIEAYYRTQISEKLELGSFISYRQNPNHVADQSNELLLLATLQYSQ